MNTKFFDHKNGRIAYDVTGEGQLVVCVPSLGDVRGEYRFLVPELVKAGYQVATMDPRGHGESSIGWDDYSVAGVGEDILALIRELGGESAIVVGTSMAGGAAIWSAVEAPDLVKGIMVRLPSCFRSCLPDRGARPCGRCIIHRFIRRASLLTLLNIVLHCKRTSNSTDVSKR